MGNGSEMLSEYKGEAQEGDDFWTGAIPVTPATNPYDEIIDEADAPSRSQNISSEVSRRINKAKLLQSLLEHDLFAPGSASDDIIDEVQVEIRSYIVRRLEVLMGIAREQVTPVAVVSPFDPEETAALKALANRALKRNEPVAQMQEPRVMPMAAPQSQINPVQVRSQPMQPQVRRQAETKAVKAAKPVKALTHAANDNSAEAQEERNEARASTRAQRVGRVKPLPMPSQGEMNAQASSEASFNLQNSNLAIGGSADLAGALASLAIRNGGK
jgi:hypothetical protein